MYIWNSNTLYGNTEFVSNYKFSGLKINALLNALTWIKNIKLGEIGVTKITPAHDPNDFEVGNRHNLERIVVINPDGTMNENAGKYAGLDRFACREELVKDLEEQNLLISVKEITHNVGHSERSGVMIEPYLSKQWFVKMRPLADAVLENQKNKDTKVNFVPEKWRSVDYDTLKIKKI